MPDELFNTEIVQNQSVSVKRHLITFKTQNYDIKNPLSSKVMLYFHIKRFCQLAFYVLALQRTEGRWSEKRFSAGTPAVLQGWEVFLPEVPVQFSDEIFIDRSRETVCYSYPAVRPPGNAVRG